MFPNEQKIRTERSSPGVHTKQTVTQRGNTCGRHALCNTLLTPRLERMGDRVFPERAPAGAAAGGAKRRIFASSSLKIPESCTKTGVVRTGVTRGRGFGKA